MTIEEENKILRAALKSLLPDKFGGYFICGEARSHLDTDLPRFLHVCPSYGIAGFATYKLYRPYSEPEW